MAKITIKLNATGASISDMEGSVSELLGLLAYATSIIEFEIKMKYLKDVQQAEKMESEKEKDNNGI